MENNKNDDVIRLGDIFRVLWKNIILIAVITAGFRAVEDDGNGACTVGLVETEYSVLVQDIKIISLDCGISDSRILNYLIGSCRRQTGH